jgi:hypothetical protein
MDKRPISLLRQRQGPRQFSWGDQRLVRERYIDQLSHQTGALYLFLVTVADAQGLRYYAERPLAERLSMSLPQLRQARQALITHNLLAYRPPLYQVLALTEQNRPGPPGPDAPDDSVDLQAVFKQIGEVLS